MKTSSTTSTRPDPKHGQSSVDRAMQYAANAILSTILRRHYAMLAKTLKLSSPKKAAIYDYLRNEHEFRGLNKKG